MNAINSLIACALFALLATGSFGRPRAAVPASPVPEEFARSGGLYLSPAGEAIRAREKGKVLFSKCPSAPKRNFGAGDARRCVAPVCGFKDFNDWDENVGFTSRAVQRLCPEVGRRLQAKA